MQEDAQRPGYGPEPKPGPGLEAQAQDTLDKMVQTFGPDETLRMAEAASRSAYRPPIGRDARKFLETRIVRSNNTEFNCRPGPGVEKSKGYT